jgi:hypothetical protein
LAQSQPDISVIIVNYNVKEYLSSCLNSIRKAASGLELEIFVVDNASTDGSKEFIPRNFPEVHYIFNKENVGFGKANNQAIRKANGTYTLIINPDTLISEDTLTVMKTEMEKYQDCGAAGCKMLNADGSFAPESRRSVPTIKSAASKVLGLHNLFPKSKTFASYYLGWLDENEASEIPVLSGAFMFYRTAVLKELDGFDERFFMYGEDIDLCYRTTEAGYSIRYVPETSIIHYKGESTRKDDIRYIKLFNKALYQFFEKHYTSRYSLLFRSLIFLAIVVRGTTAFLASRFRRGKYLLLDLLSLNIALIGAFVIRFSFTDALNEKLESLESLEFLWVNVLLSGLYILFSIGFKSARNYYLSISDSLRMVFLSYVSVTVITFFARNLAFSRVVLALGLVLSSLLLIIIRLIRINRSKQPVTSTGKFSRNRIIIVGEGDISEKLIRQINTRPDWLYDVLGTVSVSLPEKQSPNHIGTLSQLPDLVKSLHADQVYYMLEHVSFKDMFRSISSMKNLDLIFKIIPESMDFIVGKSNVEYIESTPIVEVNLPYHSPVNRIIKRIADLGISIIMVPILFILSLPFRFGSVSENRVCNGVKIALPSTKNKLLNLSRLMNGVFQGKISLVGAPLGSEESRDYRYKAGITGSVQLNADRITDREDQEKFELNYIQNYSIWMDIDILVKSLIDPDVVFQSLEKVAEES